MKEYGIILSFLKLRSSTNSNKIRKTKKDSVIFLSQNYFGDEFNTNVDSFF